MAEEEYGERLELVVFQARELYIYKVLTVLLAFRVPVTACGFS